MDIVSVFPIAASAGMALYALGAFIAFKFWKARTPVAVIRHPASKAGWGVVFFIVTPFAGGLAAVVALMGLMLAGLI